MQSEHNVLHLLLGHCDGHCQPLTDIMIQHTLSETQQTTDIMSLEAIRYCRGPNGGVLTILDQLLLPTESKYIDVKSTEDGWKVIRNMQVCAYER